MARVELGLVGNSGVGKSSFFLRWKNGSAPDPNNLGGKGKEVKDASDFSQHTRTMNVDGREVSVTIWDLQGDKEIERVRCLVYPQLSAVLVLFALDDEASLEAAGTDWSRDLNPDCFSPNKPRILVATKADLREGGNVKISQSRAKKQMGLLRARTYHETSATTGAGIEEAITDAVRQSLGTAVPEKGCCLIT